MKTLFKTADNRHAKAMLFVSGLVGLGILAATNIEPQAAKPPVVVKLELPAAKPVLVPETIETTTVAGLTTHMDAFGFDLDRVRAGESAVPRILPDSVPEDMAALKDAKHRKEVFTRMMLPMILVVNEGLANDRARIQALRDQQQSDTGISYRQKAWLDERVKEYKVEYGDFEALLKRVDVVPPSLALAQAAIESGWGTSRFARLGNALFGQWTTSQHTGIVPEKREEGKTHKIRAFHAPLDAVASYMRNLNTHRAYADLRTERAALRAAGKSLDSMAFAETLTAYSEKGMEYVGLVKSVIRVNKFTALDNAILSNDLAARGFPSV